MTVYMTEADIGNLTYRDLAAYYSICVEKPGLKGTGIEIVADRYLPSFTSSGMEARTETRAVLVIEVEEPNLEETRERVREAILAAKQRKQAIANGAPRI